MFKIIIKFSVISAVIFTLTVPALAWDAAGHKIAAYIAWQRMTPAVRERVITTLLAAPEDSTIGAFFTTYNSRTKEANQREFFMLMASWPDMIRDKNFPVRIKKYHNGNWHYADTFWSWKNGKAVIEETREESGLALQKLSDLQQVIKSNAADADKAIAIAWLEHLVGDIHQPLHTSAKVTESNQKGDQGGNLFLLTPKGTTRDKQDNLHSFWDGIVGREQPNIKDQCDAEYLDPIANEIMRLYPYDKLKDRLNDGKFNVWAKESFDIATSEVYKDVKFFEPPSEKYRKKAFEIAQLRLALAGYRMGDLFNDAFASPTAGTVPPVK